MMNYRDVGRLVQLKNNSVVVDPDAVEKYNIELRDNMTHADGIAIFNQIAEANHLMGMKDPRGYMALDNNVYDAVQATYETKYTEAIDRIHQGLGVGGAQSFEAALSKQMKNARHDITPFMPDGLKYSDLHFIANTPAIQSSINDIVNYRLQKTDIYRLNRSYTDDQFMAVHEDMSRAGEEFKALINTAYTKGSAPDTLSKSTLLRNSNDNIDGFANFASQLVEPDDITKASDDARAVASFSTSDKPTAKFLLANKSYLSSFGFEMKKAKGSLTVTWSSGVVDDLYKERQQSEMNIDMSGLDDGPALT